MKFCTYSQKYKKLIKYKNFNKLTLLSYKDLKFMQYFFRFFK